MRRTRVKICGITRLEDALAAIAAGADALGFVFYAPSPRAVSAEQARAIVAALPPFVSKVGLFVNAPADEVRQVIATTGLDCLQFHGDESAQDCAQFNLPYYKAIRVKPGVNLIQCESDFASATALLLDTYSEKAVGGTGEAFDWSLIPLQMQKPLILAGGLQVENVAQAVEQIQPYAVDISGGVEVQKGIKSPQKIAAFMRQVVQADAVHNGRFE
ncbi:MULTISPECIES: phosphoribosylanthranilate isomerase [unclassified Methylophilus]|uniref:phosphoribosylanthranilate isomerase n=1 Tax=unclassified Methylophilus TaxID=2630143 RepID=UPI0023B2ADC6|nr:phosphoribosylanthranilate isomerase [Methylophilus sp. YYY-1]MDF0376762.1 phosphoribosylanthranilate isomerase [Methylophilus sp. YYY-1]BEV08040.1 phosphoribosylanthranilate isomerase [Methylophilus sp. DW102]